MVADRIVLVTRRAGEETATRWESTGDGYALDEAERATPGTTVTLHLKPEDEEDGLRDYTDEHVLRDIVQASYSDFVAYPVRLKGDDAELDEGDLGPAQGARSPRTSTRSSTSTSRTTGTIPLEHVLRARGGHGRGARPALRPGARRRSISTARRASARPAALRQARVHHGRLRGAAAAVPALRARRGRLRRPVAQRLARDPAEGPPDPGDPQAAGQEGCSARWRR